MKQCKQCHIEKPFEQYGKMAHNKRDGRRNECKVCQSENYRKYYLSDRAYHAKRVREWDVKNADYVNRAQKARVMVRCAILRPESELWQKRCREIIGCSTRELIAHFESLFAPDMNWGNYGKVWWGDHIKPLALFDLTDPEQVKAANHYTNLRPLYALDNMKKGKKYESV